MMPWERQIIVFQVMEAMEAEKKANSGTDDLFNQ